MDRRTALKVQVLDKLASAGIGPLEAAAHVRAFRQQVEKQAWVPLVAPLAATVLGGGAYLAGKAVDATSAAGATAANALMYGVPLALAGSVGAGAMLGHNAATSAEPEINLQDVQRQELIDAYNQETERARANRRAFNRMNVPQVRKRLDH